MNHGRHSLTRRMLLLLVLLLFTSAEVRGEAPPSETKPDVPTIRGMLGRFTSCGMSAMETFPEFLKMGDKAFPAFETILKDEKSKPSHVAGAFYILTTLKSDRRRFISLAVAHLADEDADVRVNAAELLGQIGDQNDAAPIIALLSDSESRVCYQAAKTLASIGGRRDLIAMDAWLKTGVAHRNDGDYLRHVKECRDQLEKRLKKNPIPKEMSN